MNGGFNYNIIIDTVVALMVTAIMLNNKRRAASNISGRLFLSMMFCVMTVLLSDIPAWLLDGARFAGAREMLWVLNTIYYIAQVLFCFVWLLYVIYWNTNSEKTVKAWAWLVAVPLLVELALIITNPLTGWIFSITAANVYRRGTLYFMNLLPYLLYIGAGISITSLFTIRTTDSMRRRRGAMLLLSMLLPVLGLLLNTLYYGVSCLWPCTALHLMMAYLNDQNQTLLDERYERERVERELTESRMAIMLSQIQPHFLYNALSTIEALCYQDGEVAAKAVRSFAKYLRENLDSLSNKAPVPFRSEFEHLRHYLEIEKYRFDNIEVVYDVEATDFLLPALTVQPIVENAIKYGITKREEGGRVSICSREKRDHYLVTIEDNGVGFDKQSAPEGARSHIGISNVRSRLEAMCGGSLEIESFPGVGTIATITIPKERKDESNSG